LDADEHSLGTRTEEVLSVSEGSVHPCPVSPPETDALRRVL
jgi:hypothetical protein